jgi:hypothetical protein
MDFALMPAALAARTAVPRAADDSGHRPDDLSHYLKTGYSLKRK